MARAYALIFFLFFFSCWPWVLHCQVDGETAVLVPGDPEELHIRKVQQDGGIHYHMNLLSSVVSRSLKPNKKNSGYSLLGPALK